MDVSIAKQFFIISLLSGLFAILTCALPLGRTLEENFGLTFLFGLRGARKVPGNVAILAIEKKSADYFQLKQQPYKWPRTMHARAIARLSSLGATAIGFDLFFEETRSEDDDRVLAQAIKKSGNVVLLQRLTRETDLFESAADRSGIATNFISEQLLPVVPQLAADAAALAPFPLPQTPVKLNQAWLFKEGCGEKATLPTMMFALFRPSVWSKFVELLPLSEGSSQFKNPAFRVGSESPVQLDITVQRLRSLFLGDPTLGPKMKTIIARESNPNGEGPGEKKLLEAMLQLFSGNNSLIINYYGPPGTIPTLAYYTLLPHSSDNSEPDLRNKAVFIGMNHEAEMAEKDGFFTTFSDAEGKHISGVEVAATIFANLVDGSAIHPVPYLGVLTLIFSLAIGSGIVSHSLAPITGGIGVFCLCLIYLAIAYILFTVKYLWPPVIVPVMLQAPLTYVAVTIRNQKQLRRRKKNIAKALRCYIPENIAAELEQDSSQIIYKRDKVHGVCLYSDLENFTTLSENHDHDELVRIINRYYEAMFRIVKRFSGMILDIRGDSMLAFWPNNTAESTPVNQSCQAALAISTLFNTTQVSRADKLPTRVGLHQDKLYLGNIGALDHFQYTLAGDAVNTAARIESFNKQLKTRLLVSETIADNATDMTLRKMGTFLFVGKKKPLTIYELVGVKNAISERQKQLSTCFAAGLTHFEAGRWLEAGQEFSRCHLLVTDYGPARWFQQLCQDYQQHMTIGSWDGVIQLDKK